MAKAAKKVETEAPGTCPRGLYSPESTDKVKKASALVAKRFPVMTGEDVQRYLGEVGAGRILALYNFEIVNGKDARHPSKRGATSTSTPRRKKKLPAKK